MTKRAAPVSEQRHVALLAVCDGHFTTLGDLYIEGAPGGTDALICEGDLDRLEDLLKRRPRKEPSR